MKALVCGGRDYTDHVTLYAALDRLAPKVIIEGGARGADALAYNWAVSRGVERDTYLADWNKHGKAAGVIRNQQMLDEGKPDIVIAFTGGRGTQDMINRAKKANLPIFYPDQESPA